MSLLRPRRRNADRDYDEFRETLAPAANDYPVASYTTFGDVVQVLAAILNGLLLIRFFISLFISDRGITLVNLIYALTDWLVQPFVSLLGTTPAGGGGYFDWPAVLSVITISLIAWAAVRLTRAPRF
jgi:hypothetical protein